MRGLIQDGYPGTPTSKILRFDFSNPNLHSAVTTIWFFIFTHIIPTYMYTHLCERTKILVTSKYNHGTLENFDDVMT